MKWMHDKDRREARNIVVGVSLMILGIYLLAAGGWEMMISISFGALLAFSQWEQRRSVHKRPGHSCPSCAEVIVDMDPFEQEFRG